MAKRSPVRELDDESLRWRYQRKNALQIARAVTRD
jgi:hypothetical protein